MHQHNDDPIQDFIDEVCDDIGVLVLAPNQQESFKEMITQQLNAFIGERIFGILSQDQRTELERIIRDGGQDQLNTFFASTPLNLNTLLQQSLELFSLKWRQEAAHMISRVS